MMVPCHLSPLQPHFLEMGLSAAVERGIYAQLRPSGQALGKRWRLWSFTVGHGPLPLGMVVAGGRTTVGLEARHGRCRTSVTTPPPLGMQLAYSGARVGLSGDHGITDLLLAGAHRRLLLSRPPPRRTVRTLLEKQNWGVRHRGFAASPIPVLK